MWEEVEYKCTNVNFGRQIDSRKVLQPAIDVPGFSDNRYGSTLGLIEVIFRAYWSTRENFITNLDCDHTKVEMPNQL